jgi:hypothetical protein
MSSRKHEKPFYFVLFLSISMFEVVLQRHDTLLTVSSIQFQLMSTAMFKHTNYMLPFIHTMQQSIDEIYHHMDFEWMRVALIPLYALQHTSYHCFGDLRTLIHELPIDAIDAIDATSTEFGTRH